MRNKAERDILAEGFIPVATLAPGGQPPGFITTSQSIRVLAHRNLVIEARSFHVLDAIRFHTGNARSAHDLAQVFNDFMLALGDGTPPLSEERLAVLSMVVLPQGVDPTGAARYAAFRQEAAKHPFAEDILPTLDAAGRKQGFYAGGPDSNKSEGDPDDESEPFNLFDEDDLKEIGDAMEIPEELPDKVPCCCCAEHIEVDPKHSDGEYGNPYQEDNLYGHIFDVKAKIKYDKKPREQQVSDCTFEWKEKATRTPQLSRGPERAYANDTWVDLHAEYPWHPYFSDWVSVRRGRECGKTLEFTFPDDPAAKINSDPRTLFFAVKIKSSKECKTQCLYQERTVRLKQELPGSPPGTLRWG